jgi:type VI secretion system protein VasI
MKYRLLPLITLGTLTACAQDDLRRDLALATALPDGIQRLAAFDALARKHRIPTAPKTSSADHGKWSIITDTSPLDDTRLVIGRLEANERITAGFTRDKPVLIVRHKEGQLNAYIVYDVFLGTGEIAATVRFGKEPAVHRTFSISTDHKAAFITVDTRAFITKLGAVDTLLVRLTPYNESPVTITFDTRGALQVIDAIGKVAKK